jgi:hypothetical protein
MRLTILFCTLISDESVSHDPLRVLGRDQLHRIIQGLIEAVPFIERGS